MSETAVLAQDAIDELEDIMQHNCTCEQLKEWERKNEGGESAWPCYTCCRVFIAQEKLRKIIRAVSPHEVER